MVEGGEQMEEKRNGHGRVNWDILMHQHSPKPSDRPTVMLLSNKGTKNYSSSSSNRHHCHRHHHSSEYSGHYMPGACVTLTHLTPIAIS